MITLDESLDTIMQNGFFIKRNVTGNIAKTPN